MNAEEQRVAENAAGIRNWYKFGPYLSERQWGTVREDYSTDGNAWDYVSHDAARSKAYRWGEEGIAGICDEKQLLCFAFAFWNKKDPIIKERLFGLAGNEGNHGEDCKEMYYYLDNTPSHSYMKMLYKYPQQSFPYTELKEQNRRRGKREAEFELLDTGVFDNDEYFDVVIEYAKAGPDDLLIRATVHNRGAQDAPIHVLPHLWFRNTWTLGYDTYKPELRLSNRVIELNHRALGNYFFYFDSPGTPLFCENDTNAGRLYGHPAEGTFKDGINDHVVHGSQDAINKLEMGTKGAVDHEIMVPGRQMTVLRWRISDRLTPDPFGDFGQVFDLRRREADEFYDGLQEGIADPQLRDIQRQAFAGMLWSKQFYYFDIRQWLSGDPGQPAPPSSRRNGRNSQWPHLNNMDIISMPDKWEYPWYAAWDLAFHTLPLAMVDPFFAKHQLVLLTKEWYMHPNGQLPAYEWAFGDVNPPVHAWAAWRVYKIEKKMAGKGDIQFLEEVFHKLLLNFTWWVNKKDRNDNNIFQGGFLGMDNIGVFDRSAELPTGGFIEQSDGTSWMAMYSLNMLRIAVELSAYNPVYQSLATKFFEHFLYIAGAMANIGNEGINLWDDEDEFFYDVLYMPGGERRQMKIRSMVGLVPLFAVEVLEQEIFDAMPRFTERLKWFLENRPDLANLVSRWTEQGKGERHLLSLLRGHRMKKLLKRMLDETEFLSEYGVRALSRYHEKNPYTVRVNGTEFTVRYTPAEGDTSLFGGNSNWRGPVWVPMNYLLIESLQKFHHYYGNDFKVEHPTGSGIQRTLREIADDLGRRIINIFVRGADGTRPVFGSVERLNRDPHFRDHLLFYEYFHGDNGRGVGASHQTGWTGLVAKLIQLHAEEDKTARSIPGEQKPMEQPLQQA